MINLALKWSTLYYKRHFRWLPAFLRGRHAGLGQQRELHCRVSDAPPFPLCCALFCSTFTPGLLHYPSILLHIYCIFLHCCSCFVQFSLHLARYIILDKDEPTKIIQISFYWRIFISYWRIFIFIEKWLNLLLKRIKFMSLALKMMH